MKQLNKWQSIVLMCGGALMVVGAGMAVFGRLATGGWLFLVGSLLFGAMQWQQTYEGKSVVVRRLRRIMLTADALLVVGGLDMLESSYGVARQWFLDNVHNGSMTYITYIYNKWVVLLLIGAILQVYTTQRISHELDKEAKKR
jgi:hypothetical protein